MDKFWNKLDSFDRFLLVFWIATIVFRAGFYLGKAGY
jgi:hypothetical protein